SRRSRWPRGRTGRTACAGERSRSRSSRASRCGCYARFLAEDAGVTPERLIGALLEGAIGGRGKKSRGAMRYLTGGRGRGGSFLNAGTLLTAAGLAWGAYEAVQQ